MFDLYYDIAMMTMMPVVGSSGCKRVAAEVGGLILLKGWSPPRNRGQRTARRNGEKRVMQI